MKEKEILQPTDNQVQPVLLTGLFENNVDAENAYQYLLKLGYKTEEISLIMSEDTRSKYFPDTVQSQELATDAIRETENGAAIGASIGLTLGTILGVAMAVTSNLVIPGMGFLIAGPLSCRSCRCRYRSGFGGYNWRLTWRWFWRRSRRTLSK
jgi:hypothetical protein